MTLANRKAAALAAINDFVAEETAERSRRDIMHDIEARHLGRCLEQVWSDGRRRLIELMEVRGTNRNVIVVKDFESRVPTMSSPKPWPDLAGVFVFIPIEDKNNTWDELDASLAAYREANKVE